MLKYLKTKISTSVFTMTYGAETWTLKKTVYKMSVAKGDMERSMLGIISIA